MGYWGKIARGWEMEGEFLLCCCFCVQNNLKNKKIQWCDFSLHCCLCCFDGFGGGVGCSNEIILVDVMGQGGGVPCFFLQERKKNQFPLNALQRQQQQSSHIILCIQQSWLVVVFGCNNNYLSSCWWWPWGCEVPVFQEILKKRKKIIQYIVKLLLSYMSIWLSCCCCWTCGCWVMIVFVVLLLWGGCCCLLAAAAAANFVGIPLGLHTAWYQKKELCGTCASFLCV